MRALQARGGWQMERKRARDHGIRIGRFEPGPGNAITDVSGVRVGQRTVVRGDDVRTGVTAVFPTESMPWHERVYAGTHILNGYGELIGINQINEWGLLSTPVLLTSSLLIGFVYDAAVKWMNLELPEHQADDGIEMPVVTECDDSWLNDVLSQPIGEQDVFDALNAATGGTVEEGSVGAGTGMACFDFKGGIGTASRVLPPENGGYTVGALAQTNFGDREDLRIDGVPVGAEFPDDVPDWSAEGSCIVVVATDAPMLPHQVRRLAVRAGLGLARTGSMAGNGSGEQMIAFSTANRIPKVTADGTVDVRGLLDGSSYDSPAVFSPLFAATVEAVEESVVNALFAAMTTVGRNGNTLHALPIDRTLEILDRHGRLFA